MRQVRENLYSRPEHRRSRDARAGGNRATSRHKKQQELRVSPVW